MVKKLNDKPQLDENKVKEVRKKQKLEKPAKVSTKKSTDDSDFRGIIRVGNVDVDGNFPLWKGLSKIYGIGYNMGVYISRILKNNLNLDPRMKIGYLTDEEVEKVDNVLASIDTNLPSYLFNKRNDFETGSNKHIIGDDLIFSIRQDIEREKGEYTWRGYRHAHGQKVRGQRTKNTGRRGGAVGVLRTSMKSAKSKATGKETSKASASTSKPAKKV